MKNSEFGTNLRARTMSGTYPSSAALKARAGKTDSGPTHVSVNAKGEKTLHNDFYSAAKTMFGNPGWIETHPAGKIIWTGPFGDKPKLKHEDAGFLEDFKHRGVMQKGSPDSKYTSRGSKGEVQLHPNFDTALQQARKNKGTVSDMKGKIIDREETVQVGDNSSSLDKEYMKPSNAEWAKSVAAELSEAWWCGTPALEGRAERRDQERKHAGKVERSQLPDSPPKGLRFKGKPRPAPEVERPAEHMDNWVGSSNTLEACIDERKERYADAPQDPVQRKYLAGKVKDIKSLRNFGPEPRSVRNKIAMGGFMGAAETAKEEPYSTEYTYNRAALKSHGLANKLAARGESIDLSGLENMIDEVTKPKPASKPAAKPASKPSSKPKSSSAKPEKTGDENHAALLKKMAMAVTNSTAKGISPKHILAAGYAMHTFDDETLATPRPKAGKAKKESISEKFKDYDIEDNGPASLTQLTPEYGLNKSNPLGKEDKEMLRTKSGRGIGAERSGKLQNIGSRGNPVPLFRERRRAQESIENIVDGFLEDTMTGNIGSIALGFAPTGEMDPHEGRPGPGKKKKKKNQFDKLSGMVSKNRYHKLTQKVAGAMPT